MPTIVPAILEETKEKFKATCNLVMKIPGADRIQVDFGDGKFIFTKLVEPSEVDNLNPSMHWEAHLMVMAPMDFLDYKIAGFKTIIIHFEAYPSVGNVKQAVAEIKKQEMEPSVCINPDTKVEELKQFEGDVNNYLIMGVVPGKQGQEFIPETISRINELRQLIPSAIIEVDGGVNNGNVKQIAEAGADLIVVGSAIVKQPNPSEAYEKLKALI
ncbi:MAG: hypothetical protein COT92_00920 [Candidatus Doudnabacteria bacterium CG10_big_fil_rev_8_21_14_0_10_42_18]|uniref:Ribulose-phosphate 3-epimerase n=1 Tax=Candidatus Doudnabacteria bacterium CG10_big_fil_rev_8_21_14_0_10_42_18 TaxID=1974552 RepID=A0A2H0VBM9_9BACT|nr:MAG: hypothetical protein COT92_00920 [Candidatus Doudnabacteria bacterium CG10_big_fil_rev_8_21_14_0_10_42_18]